eukprot:TRINITY_DN1008_c0_g1_i1.p1 TRINITY_DN1008_c0_g1~~TRINITY_DN1008_c0_g1_i1.p1  ORF type:complete len:293 (-),score=63.34 TRINITY_DN1008_c0_g1_i1:127-1005(-)
MDSSSAPVSFPLLRRLSDARRRGEDVGYGPVHLAVSLGETHLMDHLLSCGLDKNERDLVGNSPLSWVIATDGKDELMESLIDHGAAVNSQNYDGETPLYIAAQNGLMSKVQYLLENGADVNIMNLVGATALHAAAANGDNDIIRWLVKYGAHINLGDEEGDTPLHWAVREGNTRSACYLVHLGADAHLQNEDGESAIDLANATNEHQMARDLSFVAQHSKVRVTASEPDYCFATDEDLAELEVTRDVTKQLQSLWLSSNSSSNTAVAPSGAGVVLGQARSCQQQPAHVRLAF